MGVLVKRESVLLTGQVRKMVVRLAEPVEYTLPVGQKGVSMAGLIGHVLRLEWTGSIGCVHCGRAIKKSFNQGYCYPCFRSLAQCDMCVVKPETCHYHDGTCREPEWGEQHCLVPHTVYLANSSGLKVGITRGVDPVARWIDQGASQGLRIRTVPTRLDAGRLEEALSAFVSDKTNWRKMLTAAPAPIDLAAERDRLLAALSAARPDFKLPGEPCPQADVVSLEYPVSAYTDKVMTHNLDKKPVLEAVLTGIKGQYLLFGSTVINMRKYAGYELIVSLESTNLGNTV